MKKLVTSMALGLLLAFPAISHAEEAPSAPTHTEEEIQQGIEDMENAFEQNELEVDLSDDEGVEKVVTDESGQEIGTMGIEVVDNEDANVIPDRSELFTPFATTVPKGTTKTFKVYWYAATVNYWYYNDVTVVKSTGLGQIKSVYDEDYLVIPPGHVSSDSLKIVRKNETASKPAESRYTLTFDAPIGKKLWINGKVKNGKFSTGFN
ncbi:hypothetical protein [Peribacillus sp. CSMR9]|uniref:hypothetical protein n=1 Tax=Peribacillus sp. CSMR9 TaxID=2981350 RepID=UPI002954ACC2|nr:hypothetical protein [Peribacillus sp. CSMR9]MDV7767548.1 hypothetical protein [Peribacillus sp. CSMR9]